MAEIQALFFDQDGVIVDTERHGHRVAFNKAFAEFDIKAEWDVHSYHELLQIGGGKERMRHFFNTTGIFREIAGEQLDELILKLHKRKTEILIEMITAGSLPLRPGIHRIMKEAVKRELTIGICTTSNEKTAITIAESLLQDIPFAFILAGDCVTNKKPDPEIYIKAIETAGIAPAGGLVFEDSYIGTLAAKRAGLHVAATVNDYTKAEDMSNADLVLSSLGDSEEPTVVLAEKKSSGINKTVQLEDLLKYFNS